MADPTGKWRAFWRGFFGFFWPPLLPPGSRHIFERRRQGDVGQSGESFPEADVREIERVHRRVADRLLATRGSVYEAFKNTGTGLNPDALAVWWQESPAAQSMGDQSGKAFGCALSVAMMAVEADRALRRKGRWHVFCIAQEYERALERIAGPRNSDPSTIRRTVAEAALRDNRERLRSLRDA